QARGRDPARGDLDRADRLAAERVLDLDREGIELRADAADREVAAAVHVAARVAREAVRDRVRAETLAGPARVDLQARGPAHGARPVVHRDPLPEALRVRGGGAARRRRRQRLAQRRGLAAVVGALIARAL